MKKSGNKNYTDFLAGLLVFGVFAVGMIIMLLTGAGAYKRLTARDSANYDLRICSGYVTTKIRGAEAGAVSVAEFPELSGGALCVAEEIGGETYISYVYCDGGWVREVFMPAGISPDFSAGEKLLEAESLEFSKEGGLITARITVDGGAARSVTLRLNGGEEAGQ